MNMLNRRDLLGRAGVGLGLFGLQELLAGPTHAAPLAQKIGRAIRLRRSRRTTRPRPSGWCISFSMAGPSQVDTFDPKPKLAEYAGKPLPISYPTERKTGAALPSEFKFQRYGESGLEISEVFAKTAAHADDLAVIRSMYAQVPNHEPSLMLMNCGDSVQSRPSLGSWLMYGLGSENQNLPGFIAMCPNGYPVKDTANWQSGFLPGTYQGTFIDPKHREIDKLIENVRSPHASLTQQRKQLDLLQAFNRENAAERIDERLEARIQSFELAFRMQTEASDAFDLSKETKSTIDMYGDTMHGRQTLIARRLLERGVRYVQLWHGAGQPWDHHGDIAKTLRVHAGEIDQPIAAFMTDLKRLGMFDDTLILWGGEFGRTPASEGGTGRDHNHYGFTVWLAGGGARGGTVYGSTDDFGFKAAENPVSVHDLHATMLHLLGFDHEKLTYRYAGRDFRLTDVHGRIIREII